MGTIADKLNYLASTKEAIRQALINKGANVTSGATFRSFAQLIEGLQTGGDAEVRKLDITLSTNDMTFIQAFYYDKPMSKGADMFLMFRKGSWSDYITNFAIALNPAFRTLPFSYKTLQQVFMLNASQGTIAYATDMRTVFNNWNVHGGFCSSNANGFTIVGNATNISIGDYVVYAIAFNN